MCQKLILALINLFCRDGFYCDCGYKTNRHHEFITHITQHPNGPAAVDFERGIIVW